MKNAPAQHNDIEIFDRKKIAQNHARAEKRFNDHDFLFKWSSAQILDRLDVIKRDFTNIIEIGTRDHFTNNQLENKTIRIGNTNGAQIVVDQEFLPIKPASQDLILSNLNLHTVNDVPGTLIQIKQSLKPDGLFIAALFGGETLKELRDSLMQAELNLKGGVSPRIHPFADKQDCGALMQRAGFALPVIDSERVTVTYDNMFKLLHDIRFMGEGNALRNRNTSYVGKDFFLEAARLYHEKYAEPDGRIPATFDVIFLLGWAPHDSQQKPLAPGSAKNRLADALGTTEIKT